jgi:hypothetical protein
MEIPFTALEVTMLLTGLLAGSYYIGRHLGFKLGVISCMQFLEENGLIEVEEEEDE